MAQVYEKTYDRIDVLHRQAQVDQRILIALVRLLLREFGLSSACRSHSAFLACCGPSLKSASDSACRWSASALGIAGLLSASTSLGRLATQCPTRPYKLPVEPVMKDGAAAAHRL